MGLFTHWKLITKIKPDLLHFVTMKPVLYEGIIPRLTGVPGMVAATSGLGSVCVVQNGLTNWLRPIAIKLYRVVLKHPNLKVIFQNKGNRILLVKFCDLAYDKTRLIADSGVDLAKYIVTPEPGGKPIITFASRLLKEKGVLEFIEASEILKQRGVLAEFWLVGEPDPSNP